MEMIIKHFHPSSATTLKSAQDHWPLQVRSNEDNEVAKFSQMWNKIIESFKEDYTSSRSFRIMICCDEYFYEDNNEDNDNELIARAYKSILDIMKDLGTWIFKIILLMCMNARQ
ncbi:hypothetical protein ABFS83_04G136200 [Erythranthe nasuta]